MTPAEENRATAALLAVAARIGVEEHADLHPSGDHGDDDREGLRIAADHGVDPTRLTAYRGLARSRGLTLEQVLRAAFRSELRQVVELPAVATR